MFHKYLVKKKQLQKGCRPIALQANRLTKSHFDLPKLFPQIS